MKRLSRRRLLQAGGIAGVVGGAGCLRFTGSDTGSAASPTPETEHEKTEATTVGARNQIPIRRENDLGPASQRDFQWSNDKIVITCGAADPDENADGDNAVEADITLSSGVLNLSKVSSITYVYRHRSQPGVNLSRSEANQDISVFGIGNDPDKLSVDSIREHDSTLKQAKSAIDVSVVVMDREDTEKEQLEISTSDIYGERYLGFGANVASSDPQIVTLEVFDIRGIADDGTDVFKLDHSKGGLVMV